MSTQAIKALGKPGKDAAFKVHSYVHDAASLSYGDEAAQKLGVDPNRVFKTLVAQTNAGELIVAVVPVSGTLDLKKLATSVSAKKTKMADPLDVERVTGYVLGGVSPLGQKKRLNTVIDASAEAMATVFVSAGKRGMEIELAPDLLQQMTSASFADIKSGPDPQ